MGSIELQCQALATAWLFHKFGASCVDQADTTRPRVFTHLDDAGTFPLPGMFSLKASARRLPPRIFTITARRTHRLGRFGPAT